MQCLQPDQLLDVIRLLDVTSLELLDTTVRFTVSDVKTHVWEKLTEGEWTGFWCFKETVFGAATGGESA